jgi:hypothetical protein
MKSYDHKHPKGTKYTESELRRHRDKWFDKIKGNIGLANRQDVVETDKRVYQVLVKMLPWNRTIDFMRHKDFAGSFEDGVLDQLHRFQHQCRNPAFEFVDPDLEGLRAKLAKYIDHFMIVIANQTWHENDLEWRSVPREWRLEQSERFDRVVNDLNHTANRVCDAYDTLVRTATRKLGVLPQNMTSPEAGG